MTTTKIMKERVEIRKIRASAVSYGDRSAAIYDSAAYAISIDGIPRGIVSSSGGASGGGYRAPRLWTWEGDSAPWTVYADFQTLRAAKEFFRADPDRALELIELATKSRR